MSQKKVWMPPLKSGTAKTSTVAKSGSTRHGLVKTGVAAVVEDTAAAVADATEAAAATAGSISPQKSGASVRRTALFL